MRARTAEGPRTGSRKLVTVVLKENCGFMPDGHGGCLFGPDGRQREGKGTAG